jgi:hypothetical protein
VFFTILLKICSFFMCVGYPTHHQAAGRCGESALKLVLAHALMLPRLSLRARAQPLSPAVDALLVPLLQPALAEFGCGARIGVD